HPTGERPGLSEREHDRECDLACGPETDEGGAGGGRSLRLGKGKKARADRDGNGRKAARLPCPALPEPIAGWRASPRWRVRCGCPQGKQRDGLMTHRGDGRGRSPYLPSQVSTARTGGLAHE